MIQRIFKKKHEIYALDFETHNCKTSIKNKTTSIWLGCLIGENDTIKDNVFFYTIEEMLERLETLTNKKRNNSKESRPINNICIYVHNLSFEWSFILPVLLKLGYTWTQLISENDEKRFSSLTTKTCSSVWQVRLKINKDGGIITFRDTAKIFVGSLSQIAKDYNLPTSKGSIDYRKCRLSPKYKVTKKEKIYCFDDTRIVMELLISMKEDKDFWKANSSSAYAMFKLIKSGFTGYKPYKEFRNKYPALNKKENEFLRKGVEGGITYSPPHWQFKEIKQKIIHVDAKQMHPSSAFLHRYPYGEGVYFKGEQPKNYNKIRAYRIRISYSDVRLHSIIKLIGYDFIDNFELVVWDFEIPTMKLCYVNLTIEYIDGYEYWCKPLVWRNFYKHNFELREIAKSKGHKYESSKYKLLNNGSYGKLLEKAHNEYYQNMIREKDGVIDSIIHTKEEEEINSKYTYLPVGSAIPARSRVCLIQLALSMGWRNIVYFDTDSIFAIANEEVLNAWNNCNQRNELGGWALEEYCDKAQFTAPKRYKLEVENKVIVKTAGVNGINTTIKSEEGNIIEYVPFNEINITNETYEVKRSFRCNGGTIIDLTLKEIKVQDKYKEIYYNNNGK